MLVNAYRTLPSAEDNFIWSGLESRVAESRRDLRAPRSSAPAANVLPSLVRASLSHDFISLMRDRISSISTGNSDSARTSVHVQQSSNSSAHL